MPNKNETIEIINNALQANNKKVIVLKGNWGVGKTYLWKNDIVEKVSKLKKCGYVSLFGKNSINEINKSALSTIYMVNKSNNALHKGRKLIHLFEKYTKEYEKINFAIQGIEALLSVINRENLKDTIICFDDLERIDKNIEFKDFLGYVNELAEHQKCKIVLIFNEQELFYINNTITNNTDETNTDISRNELKLQETEYKKIYDKFKEKIVDIELTYEPTFDDNFEVAINIIQNNLDEKYIDIIKYVLTEMSENNIRIISKCIETVNEFIITINNIKEKIEQYNNFPNTILLDIIKSITYITQQYWKAGHRFWDSAYIEKETNHLNDKEFTKTFNIYTSNYDKYIFQGKYLETIEHYLQGYHFDENILLNYIQEYDIIDTYYNVTDKMQKYGNEYWNTKKGKLNDYINNMCCLFDNEENAYSFFINENYPSFRSFMLESPILKNNDTFQNIFNKQMNNVIDRYLEEYQNNTNIQEDYDMIQKIKIINPDKVKLLYKIPIDVDEYTKLLFNILHSEDVDISIDLLEQINNEKYIQLCSQDNVFFIHSRNAFIERKKDKLENQIPRFLKVIAEYLMQSINDNKDNELKYNILGANKLNNSNYDIIKDINDYLEYYKNHNNNIENE